LAITTPTAPAATALPTLAWKVQVPRRSSATAPRGKPAKSAGSQPLVEPLAVAGAAKSTSASAAATSPAPERRKARSPAGPTTSPGAPPSARLGGAVSSKYGNSKACVSTA
jgi:hypothetical protein